jgi:hypothetical protein
LSPASNSPSNEENRYVYASDLNIGGKAQFADLANYSNHANKSDHAKKSDNWNPEWHDIVRWNPDWGTIVRNTEVLKAINSENANKLLQFGSPSLEYVGSDSLNIGGKAINAINWNSEWNDNVREIEEVKNATNWNPSWENNVKDIKVKYAEKADTLLQEGANGSSPGDYVDASELNIGGNSASASKLQSSVNIGGVGFDGSSSIDLPGVNILGNQDTTGNAASATTAENANKLLQEGQDGSSPGDYVDASQLNIGGTAKKADSLLQNNTEQFQLGESTSQSSGQGIYVSASELMVNKAVNANKLQQKNSSIYVSADSLEIGGTNTPWNPEWESNPNANIGGTAYKAYRADTLFQENVSSPGESPGESSGEYVDAGRLSIGGNANTSTTAIVWNAEWANNKNLIFGGTSRKAINAEYSDNLLQYNIDGSTSDQYVGSDLLNIGGRANQANTLKQIGGSNYVSAETLNIGGNAASATTAENANNLLQYNTDGSPSGYVGSDVLNIGGRSASTSVVAPSPSQTYVWNPEWNNIVRNITVKKAEKADTLKQNGGSNYVSAEQ